MTRSTGRYIAGAFVLLLAGAAAMARDEPQPPVANVAAEDAVSFDEQAALAGTYELVGRYPDSGTTYSGTVTLAVDGNALRARRVVGGRTSVGVARIDYRTPDRIPVLVISFAGNKRNLEAWCRWQFDLDNYARFTCLSRWQGTTPSRNGLEAWFIAQEP